MLQFPAWKILLILGTLVWGVVMALPSVVDMSGAPGFIPKKGVNLGLDLQGGVYLMMEIDEAEVAANRLEVFAIDVRGALGRSGDKKRIGHLSKVRDGALFVEMTKAGANGDYPVDEAIERIRKVNPTLQGAIGGAKMFEIAEAGRNIVRISVPAAANEAIMKDALGKTMTIVRRRVDPDGVSEVSITPQGVSRIILEAPGEADPQRLKDLLSRDGKMTFNLVESSPIEIEQAQRGVVKPGYSLLSGPGVGDLLVRDIPEIFGSDIATASQGNDESNRPKIDFRLNSSGARKFYDTTLKNSGKRFAIVLDDVIMSAPNINEPIPGGSVQITGDFSITEAQDLAAIIEAGEMPAKVQFLDQRTVSATLGEDSIRAGMRASIIGLILVAVFMILAYGLMGCFTVASLAFNIVLLLGALSGLGATLTLPGIAGIILTIGMAVDANVLVFERIREEQRSGRSPVTAVQAGYERALSTILDANITTFIAAIVLYLLGSGPVKGFAVTLAIGIITSVFTAFVVTRWFTSIYLKAFRPKKLAI